MNYGPNRLTKTVPGKIGWKTVWNSHQNMVLFLMISFLPMMLCGILSYYGSREILIKNTTKDSLALLSQTVTMLQLKLTEFERVSMEFFINDEFRKTVTSYLRARDSREKFQAQNDIESYFNKSMINNPDIFALMFTGNYPSGDTVILCRHGDEAVYDMARQFRNTITYKNIYRAGGGVVWSSPLEINARHYLILGRLIKDTLSGENLGVLSIIINEEQVDRLANLNVYNRLNMLSGAIENFRLIINDQGEIVSTVFKQDIGRTIREIMTGRELPDQYLSVSNHGYHMLAGEGSFITRINGKETLVTFKSIGNYIRTDNYHGWYLLSLAPTAYLYSELKRLYVIMIITGLFLHFAGLWLMFRCQLLPGFFKTSDI